MRLRYERKYLVPNTTLAGLRARIQPFVRPDSYSLPVEGRPQYTVRSIYYDSIAHRALDEKMEGLKDRKKLRVRGYGMQTPESIIFLEIKRKLSDRIGKHRARLRYSDLQQLFDIGDTERLLLDSTHEGDDAKRFLYNLHRHHMTPASLVVYDREAYHGLFDHGLRITFDKNIRTRLMPELTELWTETDLSQPWAGHFIFEVKYFESPMPLWVRSVLQEFGLRHEALSKYAEGLMHNASETPFFDFA